MKLRTGFVMGFAVGYYLGAMAGRQRYDQLNRVIGKVRQSNAVDMATGKAKHAADVGFERAKEGVQHKMHHNNGSRSTGVYSPS